MKSKAYNAGIQAASEGFAGLNPYDTDLAAEWDEGFAASQRKMAESARVKPCPFCGGYVETGYYAEEFVVDCPHCQYQISTYDGGPEDPSIKGIARWNARPDTQADLVEALIKLRDLDFPTDPMRRMSPVQEIASAALAKAGVK